MVPGERYDMVLTVMRRSHYQAIVFGDLECTKYRYAMMDRSGTHYVFTGSYVHGLDEGITYKVRATVKEYDGTYRHWRLKRLAIVQRVNAEETLL